LNGFFTADYRKLPSPQAGSASFKRQGEGPAPSGPWSNPPVPAPFWTAGQNTPAVALPGQNGDSRNWYGYYPVGDDSPPLPPGPPWTWAWKKPGGFRDGNADERT